MKPVERGELLDYATYGERRDALRARAMRAKDDRRVVVGEALTFLFENRDTVRYQVQEMMRTERIVKEADIAHELATYNELLGGTGELGCTLLIGIADERERDEKLRAWLPLPRHVYAELEDGSRIQATYDPRQVGRDRLSSVQYLKFPVGPRAPVAVGCDLEGLTAATRLSSAQREALQADLDHD
jgi:hypothetical protein